MLGELQPAATAELPLPHHTAANNATNVKASVDTYHPRTATLRLSHRSLYPGAPEASTKAVLLDISMHVRSLPSGLTTNGEWLNVIGYIVEPPENISNEQRHTVHVQAIQIWSAGNIDLGAYESSVRERLELDRKTEDVACLELPGNR